MRLAPAAALLLLAACGQAPLSSTPGAWAVVSVMPRDVSRTFVVTVDAAPYSGEVQPGPLPGQSVTVTSPAGARLACTFSPGDWRYTGPGSCRDENGREHRMVLRDFPRDR
jgi:hypothetical protein